QCGLERESKRAGIFGWAGAFSFSREEGFGSAVWILSNSPALKRGPLEAPRIALGSWTTLVGQSRLGTQPGFFSNPPSPGSSNGKSWICDRTVNAAAFRQDRGLCRYHRRAFSVKLT